jgi:dienelactone hydrolase
MSQLLRFLAIFSTFFLLGQTCAQEITSQVVEYTDGNITMRGFLAAPAAAGVYPGVLIVHEWWGHNDYARQRAEMLAKEGFVALAVDMYGEGKTADHPKEAGSFASAVAGNIDVAEARFRAALNFLQAQENVAKTAPAALGYCFGGAVVLNMARRGLPLNAVISYHGSLKGAEKAEKISEDTAIVVFHGGADALVPPAQVAAFVDEMLTAGADLRFINYPGVQHSFTSRAADDLGQKFGLPLAYDAAADADSWQQTLSILNARLRK